MFGLPHAPCCALSGRWHFTRAPYKLWIEWKSTSEVRSVERETSKLPPSHLPDIRKEEKFKNTHFKATSSRDVVNPAHPPRECEEASACTRGHRLKPRALPPSPPEGG
jgi:hypothetical protein